MRLVFHTKFWHQHDEIFTLYNEPHVRELDQHKKNNNAKQSGFQINFEHCRLSK